MRSLPVILTLVFASPATAQPEEPGEEKAGEAGEATANGEGPAEGAEGAEGGAEGAAEEAAAPEEALGLEALRKRYLTLRDRLFKSRARAQSVSSALYSSRIRIELDYASDRFYSITRATIRLDGANVYDDTSGEVTDAGGPRFEGFIAPGRHSVTVRVEATAKDDERFRTASEQTFVVYAPEQKDLLVQVRSGDDGNIGYSWSRKESGSYKLQFTVKVKAVKRGKKQSGHIKRSALPTGHRRPRG